MGGADLVPREQPYQTAIHCQRFSVAPDLGVGHDHVRAIFADSACRNVCESPIIQDHGISRDLY